MGGKGKPVATNNQLVQMQMQQAAEAKQANLERNARLQQGTKSINAIFQGSAGTPDKVDLSGLTNQADVAYDPFRVNGQIWNEGTKTWDQDPSRQLGGGYSWGKAQPASDTSGQNQYYAIYGPDGFPVAQADTLADLSKQSILTGTTSGASGGFGDDFYDKYRQASLDYYMPQEKEQYSTARSGLAYSLARAGQLNSSVAGMDVGKLAKQDLINQAQITSQADTSTGQLRSQIASEQEQALNQLYATEDPSVAANTAQNMVANADLQKPILNPAGALFAPLAVGVGNALAGFTNPYAYISGGQTTGGGGYVPATPSAGTDTSKNVSV